MAESWSRVEVNEDLRALERPFLDAVEGVLREHAGESEEAYWYLAWRLELASISRNLVDQSKVRRELFEAQGGLCGECGGPLRQAAHNDVHKRQRIFARHQGYVPGNVVLLHRECHEGVHAREPHSERAI